MNNKRFEIGASEQPLDIIKETCGFAGIFKQIGVIGDSLASGEFESHDENGNIVYTDMYEYSWPAVLERITGTKYNNYSRGGMTAREYVQSWADANGFWQWNQAYIIALGNNDSFVFGHPLGSVKDVNADCPQDNADTFFGNMGKIVCKLKTIEPNARIFVVTPQLRGEACDNDIRYIASELAKLCDMFEFTYLLDMTAHAPVYDAEMRKSFGLGFHPNPMGYYAYALTVGNYVRMSEVASSIGVTLATLTVACDKLVAKGLVRRVRSQEDRRVVNIMLTDKGRAAYEYHKDFHERMIASLVDTLSPEQTALLAQSLEKLQDFFRHEEAAVEGETNG